MTVSTRPMLRGLAAAAVIAAVSGCGNDGTASRTTDTIKELKALVVRKKADPAQVPAAPPNPTDIVAKTLAALPDVPLQFVAFEKTGAFAVTSIFGQNGDVVTWITADKLSMSFDKGMLTATRGFGGDLMSVDDGGAAELISGRKSGQVSKTYRVLDGLENTSRIPLTCTIAPQGTDTITVGEITANVTIMSEVCALGGQQFANAYWIDGQGRMLQSAQWAGPTIGNLAFQRLRF